MKWIQSKHQGVRYREHPTRKHGIKPDKYFAIRAQVNGKRREEGLGWSSEGWTEQKAAQVLAELKKAHTTGEGPVSLQEKRALAEAARQEELETKRRTAREGISFNRFWEEDYSIALSLRLKPSSRTREEGNFKHWLSPILGDMPLRDIRDTDLERVQEAIRANNLAPRTHEYIIGTFRRAWKHAQKRKIVGSDCPVKSLHIPDACNNRTRVVTPQEIQAILNELSVIDINAHDITLFLALTGCRASEAFNLTWGYVDFEHRAVSFHNTKNNKSRTVYLSDLILSTLKQRGPQEPDAYVFTQNNGKQYKQSPSAFRTVVENLGLNTGRARLDRLTYHTLRHSAATFAARQRTQVKDMQEIFGWKTPAMVFRYVHGSEIEQRRAVRGLEASLLGDKGKLVAFPTQHSHTSEK